MNVLASSSVQRPNLTAQHAAALDPARRLRYQCAH